MKNNEIIKHQKEKNNEYLTIDLINLSIKNPSKTNNNFETNLSSFYLDKNQIFNLSVQLDNLFKKIKNYKFVSKKFDRNFEYIDKIITLERYINYKNTVAPHNLMISNLTKLIIHIIKNNINASKHQFNEKLFKILILMVYWEVFPIKNFILIINIFLTAATNIIIQEKKIIDSPSAFNNSPLYFINDLFEAITNIPRKLINDNLHIQLIDELINILDETLFSFPFYLDLNKTPIWFKLLGNKITNFDIKQPLAYSKLISFLVKIYKYNYQNSFYYNYFYEQSAISFDYYINSLDFLFALFKEEEKKRLNDDFKIKSGFYIYNNIPLTLNNIKCKLNSFSIIFSFKLTKICNNNEDIFLLNIENYELNKFILRFVIDKNERLLKIIDGKNNNEWNTNININLNKDYLICLSQESKFFDKKIDIFINDNNNFNYYSCKTIGFPDFYQNLTLDLGKSNFEGIFGEFIIINKKIKSEDINYLYRLKENYADVISTINYKNDFTYKNKNHKSTNEEIIFFKNLKYQCVLKISPNQFNSILNNYNSLKLNPYGELKYTKYIANNDNKELNIKLYRIIYSIENFLNLHGLEYLIFQLHRIISLSENDELLNYYLYKTLYFVLEYIKIDSNYIFPKKDNKVKTEKKYTNFILSLITILNTKKRKLELNEKIMDILLSFSKIYREKKAAYILQKINFSILLDGKIFKKMKLSIYEKLFDEMNLYLKNEEKENSLLYKELFYKFLLLDEILESKEIKHKKYMSIINYFIIGNKKNKLKDINSMRKIFINYLINIKSEKKIYHYLKIIYLNFESINLYFQENENFVQFIIANSNQLINNNSKYNEYIRILSFLLIKFISKLKVIEKEENNYNNIKNANYKFIKCLFIQNFIVNNNIKLSFIKSTIHPENEMKILNSIYKQKNLNIFNLIDKVNFIYKLNPIIIYCHYIYNEYLSHKNNKIETLLKRSVKLIIDFIDEISNRKEFNTFESFHNLSDDSIIQNKDSNNLKKINKDSLIHKFINELFTSSGIKLLFVLYFNIYEENELKGLKFLVKYINISIDKIYNPFYFYLLLSKINLNNDINTNNYYKFEIFHIIINSIIFISNKINNILVLNSIIILIRIYYLVLNDSVILSTQFQKNIINYLKYIFENYYIYSKVVFDINSLDENIIDIDDIKLSTKKENKLKSYNTEKKPQEHKLLLEIAFDIIFNLLEKYGNNEIISFLYYNLKFNENNNIFYLIDEFSFLEVNNNINQSYKNNVINFLNNQKIISKYCSGINLNNILSSVYFLIYFINKENIFISNLDGNKENEKIKNEIINFFNKTFENLFKTCMNIFKTNQKKIKKNKNKIRTNEIIFKSYDIIYDHFISKYKDNYFNLNEGKDIYEYYNKLLQNSQISDNIEKNKENKLFLSEKKELMKTDTLKSEQTKNKSANLKEFPSKGDNINKDEIKKNLEYKGFTTFDEKNDKIKDNKKERLSIDSDLVNKPTDIKKPKNKLERLESSLTNFSSTNINDSSSESDSENSSFEDNNKLSLNENEKAPLNIIIEKDNARKKSIEENEKIIDSNDNIIINEYNLNKIKNNNNEHKYLLNKLDLINIPNLYYKKLMSKNDPRWVRIVFNPKRTIFKIFGFFFKNYIFNNQRFNKLRHTFKVKFKNVELEKSIPEEENYFLKYPSKLKNFICNDYYKPFLKPNLDFFENEYFIKAHPYIKNDIYKKGLTEKDKFSNIYYEKLILDKKNKYVFSEIKNKTRCENISNKGSVFGSIYFFHSLMIFRDHSNKDERESKDISETDKLFFLFSSDISDRLQNTNKYIIIFYNEIKEIVLRKYCFNEIAYEIFMKDNRSYFFNFFSIKNSEKFYDNLISKINLINAKIKTKNINEISIYKKYKYDDNYINILFIETPKLYFEKNDIKEKYIKNEITNFQYLLLVNKFSSRSYNDCNQYLIFPLLYMDIDKKKERDLSKAICLNKELDEEDYNKYKNNYESMGYHFNNHYATMAYILYYLTRVIPFTYSQIKLQSGHFDAPSRQFSSLNNLLYVFQLSDENRELCPEFFYFFESFLNLNYNDFGYSKTDKRQINHFNTNQNCGIVEFIIDLRNMLEKKELSPWINNIFGCNQISGNYNSLNKFPEYSYEQYNNFNDEKESLFSEIGDEMNDYMKKKINDKIQDLKGRIQLLSLGLTPSQLFKHPHPNKEKNSKKNLLENNNDNKNKKSKKKLNINKNLIDFIEKTSFKDLEYVFNNNDNEHLKIIFILNNIISIFNFILETQPKNINLEEELKIIKIKPYKNCFVELYDNTFLISRLINRTLLLCYGKEKIYIEWPCIVTAIELYSHDQVYSNSYNEIHLNKIIIGDEEGNLALIEIETELKEKKKEFKINLLNSIQKRYKTFSSYINGILYNKRLNIIISSCNEGFISINNGFSFEILNIIKIGNNSNIIDFKLSEYDLLYIYINNCNNKESEYILHLYTINGIKIQELKSKNEYIDFIINNNRISTICKNGNIYEYNCANLKEIKSILDKEDLDDIAKKGEIIYCMECNESQNVFIIFNKDIKVININKEI